MPASTPNPVYAKYRAWLATPQGRAVSGRLAAPFASAAPSPPARGGSAALPLVAVIGLLAAAGAGTAAVIARGRRRPVPGRPARPGPPGEPPQTLYPDAVPGPEEYVPYPGFSSVGFTDDYLILGERTPYRIPPYSPPPGPSRSAAPPAEF